MDKVNVARIHVSGELLRDLLFPEGTEFVDARMVHGFGGGDVIEFVVKHPDLPLASFGDEIPLRTILGTRIEKSYD